MSIYGNNIQIINEKSVYQSVKDNLKITVDEDGNKYPNFKYDPYIKVYQHGGYTSSGGKCARISLNNMCYVIHNDGADFEKITRANKKKLNVIIRSAPDDPIVYPDCETVYDVIKQTIAEMQHCKVDEVNLVELEKIDFMKLK